MRVKELVEAYISYRRSLGSKYVEAARILHCFARHAGEDKDAREINLEICTSFLYGKEETVTYSWFSRYSILKMVFEWAIVRGYMDDIPLPNEKPKRPRRMPPYIYSRKELMKIFDAAMTYQKNRSKIPPECIQTILKVTYVLGLRLNETLSLKSKDINLQELHVIIRETKFNKTRIVPFNHQVRDFLQNFINWRASQHPDCGNDTHLFLDKNGRPIHKGVVQHIFIKIRNAAGISRSDGVCCQPRIHDLRHTFAVNRLTVWYRDGKDVQNHISLLSTYLGHDKVSYTSVYLTMTDDLLKEASKRFKAYTDGKKL